jgi:hypothetical protein
VSAGGRETARYAGGDGAALAHVRALQERGLTAMVQPYLPAIDEEGETDLIFVDGRYSHAVIKQPMLRVGEGVVAQSWERMAWSGLASPSPEQLAVAGRAVEMISARVQEVPAYCRIDLITGPRGDPVLLEAEMIDPYLSFDLAPAGAASLAAAVLGR